MIITNVLKIQIYNLFSKINYLQLYQKMEITFSNFGAIYKTLLILEVINKQIKISSTNKSKILLYVNINY